MEAFVDRRRATLESALSMGAGPCFSGDSGQRMIGPHWVERKRVVEASGVRAEVSPMRLNAGSAEG